MNKNRKNCVIDDLKLGLLRYVIECGDDDLKALQEAHPVPEKKSPLAKYKTEELLDEPCPAADGRSTYMDTFLPVISNGRKHPVIVDIHGGGFVREDRSRRLQYHRALASRGFLVFAFDYILSDDTSVTRELRDICGILEAVSERMKSLGADPSKVFLTGDSAGAYLAVYTAAMCRSEKLRDAVGCGVPPLTFAALGLHCGMFYIDRCDPAGWLLSMHECSMSEEDRKFRKYIDPECGEVIGNLPPVFLSTSRGDILSGYTVSFHAALKKAGKRTRLVYLGDNNLIHSFPALIPNLPESIDIIDKMTVWFNEELKEARKEQRRLREEKKALDKISARIERGEIIEQKVWKFIRELNSCSKERLDSAAVIDGGREYTYRQMFRRWERYAEVFSALGMTGKNHSRVAIRSVPAAETIFAMFGLNMTGASVSLGLQRGANRIARLRGMKENENITDVILPDSNLDEAYLRQLMKEKDALGIRNVIVMHVPRTGEFVWPWEETESLGRYDRLKKIEGVLFMDELLEEYEAFPICFDEDGRDDAMITHTSGTTTGANKPVPISDRGLNETSARLLADSRFEMMKGRASTLLLVELGSAYSLCDELLLPFAFGGRVALLPPSGFGVPSMSMDTLKALKRYHVNVFFGGPLVMEMLLSIPLRPDLSDLEFVFLGGSYVSLDARKRYNRYLKACGAKIRVSVGYGLSEAGGACMLSSPDRDDDAIGWPLKGIRIRLYDEENGVFHDPAEGPAEGVMYLCAPSVSCGRIDDKTFFELKEIDGEQYLNTYDLVRTGEDGAFYYCGRMNKYFVNNSQVRFDAGLVESAVSAQPKIESCGLVPGYDKIMRDTVPVLYIKPTLPAKDAKSAVRGALKGAFITRGTIKDTNLPSECVITDNIPYNDSGKVDIRQITTGNVDGYRFRVIPVRHDGVLTDIRLVPYRNTLTAERGFPEELENGR